jgi:tight adherence protein C
MQMLAGHMGSVGRVIEANMLPLIGAFTFGFVFLAVVAIVQLVQARQSLRRRAVAFNPTHVSHPFRAAKPAGFASSAQAEDATELLYLVEKGLPAGSDSRISKIRRELIRAGFFGRDAVLWYYVIRLASGCLFALAAWSILPRLVPSASASAIAGLTLAGAAQGLLLPSLVLRRYQKSLIQQCRNGFPTFLDLLVVCSEAGLTPRAGIERVSRELTRTHPFLGANLFLMFLELRAGRPLVEAVESLGRRVQIDEVRSLGTLLQQTEQLGTNLSTALRVYSDEMRARRLLRAEERAHVLPVKLVLPLALFVFPAMLIVALLPVFVRISRAFLASGG